jgi:hypothetical protein
LTAGRRGETLTGMRLIAGFALLAAFLFGACAWLNKRAPPACQGDPALKPCTCMDARTPGCLPPLNDDATRGDGGHR